jgi:hypothetical protein
MEVFGLQAGFFYLPIAIAREWGYDGVWCGQLGVALATGHAHFALQDTLVDNGALPPLMALQGDVFLLMYLDRITELAGETVDVRTLHQRYYSDYCAALASELARRKCLIPFDSEDVRNLGAKAAPGNVILHIVAEHAGRAQTADRLVTSMKFLCTAFQLQDDLGDLEEDLEAGIMTVPSTLAAMRSLGIPPGPLGLDRSTRTRLAEAVFLGGAAEATLALAHHYLDRALAAARDARALVMIDLIEVCRRRNEAEAERVAAERVALGLPPMRSS